MTTAKITAAYEATLDAIVQVTKNGGSHNGRESHLAALHDSLAPYANPLPEASYVFEGAECCMGTPAPDSLDSAETIASKVSALIYDGNSSDLNVRDDNDPRWHGYDIPATISKVIDAHWELGRNVSRLESELGVAKQAATDAENKCDIYRTENDRLSDLAAERGEQVQATRKTVVSKKDYDALRVRADYLQTTVTSVHAKNARLHDRVASAEAEAEKLRGRVDEANNLALRKQEETLAVKVGHKRVAKQNENQFETITSLRKELRELKAKLNQVQMLTQADAVTKAKIDAEKVARYYGIDPVKTPFILHTPTFGSFAVAQKAGRA